MTLKTWKDEFYPVPADDPSIETDLQAIEHSLRKWEGLRYENRAKHDISTYSTWGNNRIEGEDEIGVGMNSLTIDADSCALCERHFKDSPPPRIICGTCPLYKERGVRCDSPIDREEITPYSSWVDKVDPEPMIELLKAALETEKMKNGE